MKNNCKSSDEELNDVNDFLSLAFIFYDDFPLLHLYFHKTVSICVSYLNSINSSKIDVEIEESNIAQNKNLINDN